jgi:hypothetical protein
VKLDALELPGATLSIKPTKKMTVYQYLWCDVNAIEESGLGVRSIGVSGICTTSAERDAIEQACESKGVKKLYFSSAQGLSDDRYYKVQTNAMQHAPVGYNASLYGYSFECLCSDPAVYVTATDLAVW